MIPLPIWADLKEVVADQRAIIQHLQVGGLTLEEIAKVFGVENSSSLRGFVRPSKDASTFRRTNKTVLTVHGAILGADDDLPRIIDPVLYHRYRRKFSERSDTLIYTKQVGQSGEIELRNAIDAKQTFQPIIRDFLNINQSIVGPKLTQYVGNYYFFYPSYRHDCIVKGILSISGERSKDHGSDYSFTVYVPNRDYQFESHRNQNKYRILDGVLTLKEENLVFLGTSEQGRAYVSMTAKASQLGSLQNFRGFCTASGETGQLFNAKFIAVRQNIDLNESYSMARIKLGDVTNSRLIDRSTVDHLTSNGELTRSWTA